MKSSSIINIILFIVLIQSAMLVYIQYRSNDEREFLVRQIEKVIEDNYKRNIGLGTADEVLGDRTIV